MTELFDLHTSRVITLLVCCIAIAILSVWLIYEMISIVIIRRRIRKLAQALKELDTMPLDKWEAKWANYIQKGYIECNDPHRQEIEEDMEFFHKELAELKKGGQHE